MRQLPATVWRLTIAFALMMSGTSMMVLIAGIIGTEFAPSVNLATLPIALTIVGVACSTLPTGKLLGRYGRKPVFMWYAILAVGGGLLASVSLVYNSFLIFCCAAVVIGWAAAAGHQYRFAALEAVAPHQAHKATSAILMGGILGAFVGPELAVLGRYLLDTEYAGSYLLLAAAYFCGILIISGYKDRHDVRHTQQGQGRALSQILAVPQIRLAIAASTLAYAIMSFIMTATPISMHNHAGHSLEATKFVIQSHIAAMYVPSLLFGWFFGRLGFQGMFWTGLVIYILCLGIGLIDTSLLNYWGSLVLLGIGWNFLFLSGTNLLPHGYQPEERFRVQSTNDFLVFSVQATVALSSGWFLAQLGWQVLLLSCMPLILVFAIMLWRWRRQLDIPVEPVLPDPT
jgi:MFS family permease